MEDEKLDFLAGKVKTVWPDLPARNETIEGVALDCDNVTIAKWVVSKKLTLADCFKNARIVQQIKGGKIRMFRYNEAEISEEHRNNRDEYRWNNRVGGPAKSCDNVTTVGCKSGHVLVKHIRRRKGHVDKELCTK